MSAARARLSSSLPRSWIQKQGFATIDMKHAGVSLLYWIPLSRPFHYNEPTQNSFACAKGGLVTPAIGAKTVRLRISILLDIRGVLRFVTNEFLRSFSSKL